MTTEEKMKGAAARTRWARHPVYYARRQVEQCRQRLDEVLEILGSDIKIDLSDKALNEYLKVNDRRRQVDADGNVIIEPVEEVIDRQRQLELYVEVFDILLEISDLRAEVERSREKVSKVLEVLGLDSEIKVDGDTFTVGLAVDGCDGQLQFDLE